MTKFVTPGKFRQAQSDFTAPENSGLRFLLNPIDQKATFKNSINETLGKKWKKAREEGKGWFASRNNFKMGEIQTVAVQSDVWIINSLCMDENAEVSDPALEKCMKKIADSAKYEKATIHVSEDMLEIGSFQELAKKYFLENGLNVYVYRSTNNKT